MDTGLAGTDTADTGLCNGADADGDGVCDDMDLCPGHDDAMDSDGDGIPDGCDPWDGYVLDFDGTTYLECEHGDPGWGTTDGEIDKTLAVWVRMDIGDWGGEVFDANPSESCGEGGQYELKVIPGYVQWRWDFVGYCGDILFAVPALQADGLWHLVQVDIHDDEAPYGWVRLLLDGAQVETRNARYPHGNNSSAPALLGARQYGGQIEERFTGEVAELAVWLGEDCPRNNELSPVPGAPLDHPNALVRWAALDPNSVIDLTGNGNTCTTLFDLALDWTGYTPHVGQTLWITLWDVTEQPVSLASSWVTAVDAYGELHERYPGVLLDGRTYDLHWVADMNGNGTCDDPPVDHGWSEALGEISAHVNFAHSHDLDFDPTVCTWIPY